MRNAITVTFVVTYFVLLGFLGFQRQQTGATIEPNPLGATLVTNFTVLMGVVIAFYFGGVALEKVTQINATAASPGDADAIAAAAEEPPR